MTNLLSVATQELELAELEQRAAQLRLDLAVGAFHRVLAEWRAEVEANGVGIKPDSMKEHCLFTDLTIARKKVEDLQRKAEDAKHLVSLMRQGPPGPLTTLRWT